MRPWKVNMKTRISFVIMIALALTLPEALLMIAKHARAEQNAAPPRPHAPCDIYAAAGTP